MEVPFEVAVRAPDVRRAADAVRTEERASLRDEDGHLHPVTPDSRVSGFVGTAQNPTGDYALRDIARACEVQSSALCLSDSIGSNDARQTSVSAHRYWLKTQELRPDPNQIEGYAILTLGLGLSAGFVAAQVTCFSSWCGTGGKVAFVASDVALGASAFAIGGLFMAMTKGMNH